MFVSTKNFRTARPSKKLDLKFVGPYKVLRLLSNDLVTYEVKLLANLSMYNKFYTSLL